MWPIVAKSNNLRKKKCPEYSKSSNNQLNQNFQTKNKTAREAASI